MATVTISDAPKPPVIIVSAPYSPAGPVIAGTSSTPADISIGGTYTFEMDQTGLGFVPGFRIRAAVVSDPLSWIEGVVLNYDVVTSELVVASDLIKGFGVHSDWNINVAGEKGQKGDKGDTGAMGPQGPAGGLVNPNVILTGTPTCPTAPSSDISLQLANTTYVRNVLTANYQPLDADLTSIAAAVTVGDMYYRSGAGVWSPVTLGANLTFTGGTLNAVLSGTAPIDSPVFTGDPQAPTAAKTDNDTSIATTAYVKSVVADYAPLASPALTGTPTVPTAAPGTNTTQAASTGFVTGALAGFQPLDADLTGLAAFSASGVMAWRKADGDWRPVVIGANLAFDATSGTLNASGGSGGSGGIPEAPTDGLLYGRQSLGWVQAVSTTDLAAYAKITSPSFNGSPLAPTPNPGDNTQRLATTQFVTSAVAVKADLASPALTGAPTAPTPAPGTNTTQLATSAFVAAALAPLAPLASPVFTGNPQSVTPPTADSDTSVATTAFVQAAIQAALVAAGGTAWTTGDVKVTMKKVADPGWILMNDGTIGDATSGATTRAHADCQAIFTLIWDNTTDAWCPVVGGRGATALADWNAHKKLTLPRALGRALIGAGQGAGLQNWVLGSWGGEESHTPTVAELASHGHPISDPTHVHTYPNAGNSYLPWADVDNGFYFVVDGGSTCNVLRYAGYIPPNQAGVRFSATGVADVAVGSTAPHNVVQPSLALTVMIKL